MRHWCLWLAVVAAEAVVVAAEAVVAAAEAAVVLAVAAAEAVVVLAVVAVIAAAAVVITAVAAVTPEGAPTAEVTTAVPEAGSTVAVPLAVVLGPAPPGEMSTAETLTAPTSTEAGTPMSTATSTSAVAAIMAEAAITAARAGAVLPPGSRRVPSSAVPSPVRPIRRTRTHIRTRTRLVPTQITRIADFERRQHFGTFRRHDL
jgi:hypothetical protein